MEAVKTKIFIKAVGELLDFAKVMVYKKLYKVKDNVTRQVTNEENDMIGEENKSWS